jgi:hypothetical protein
MALNHAIASDLSYAVLQKRRREFQLQTPELDSRLRNLYGLPSQLVQREAFAADRETVPDSYQGEAKAWPDLTPTWHRHRGK